MEGYIPPSYHMKYVRFNYDCIAAIAEGFSLPSSHWRTVYGYTGRGIDLDEEPEKSVWGPWDDWLDLV